MAHLRIRPNGRIQFDLHLYGQYFREGTKQMATPKNVRLAQATLKQMNAEIDLGTFQYREKYPDRLYPFFNDFANQWYERQKGNWKSSYQGVVRNTLEHYLLPHFGNTLVSEVSLFQVNFFRQTLQEGRKKDGTRKLNNKRINSVFVRCVHCRNRSLYHDEPWYSWARA